MDSGLKLSKRFIKNTSLVHMINHKHNSQHANKLWLQIEDT